MFLGHAKQSRPRHTPLALLLILLTLPACVSNPATGKKEFVPFMPSKSEQLQIGLQAAPKFEAQGGGRFPNPAVQTYVNAVGQKIAASVPRDQAAGYQFSYTVLNDPAVNAFALPGGPIYITQGLLFKLHNEAELAFVLGHETGHVIAQHVGRQMSKSTELQLLLAAAGIATGGKDAGTAQQAALAVGNYASQIYLLKFSREEESQADTLGLQYLVATHYDPQAALAVMHILQSASGSSGGNDWLSTHPSTPTRIADLQKQIQQKYPSTLHNPAYQLYPQPFQQNVLQHPPTALLTPRLP